MKKIMMVVGVAACVTLVGCKNDEYGAHKIGNKARPVEIAEPAPDPDVPATKPAETVPATVEPTPGPTQDEQPVTTIAAVPDAPAKDDVVADAGKNVAVKDAGKADAGKADAGKGAAAVEPEFTPYVVRGGDTLGGICLRYKVKKADVLALNPGMDPNKIFVGRTIKLPGHIAVAKPATDAKPAAKPAAGRKAGEGKSAAKRKYEPYTGETKEYVVKKGDMIGSIAYSNGISIRQFKELNGLKSDFIREGQKVKIPAVPVKSSKPVAVADAAKKEPGVLPDKAAQIQPVAGDKPAEAPVAVSDAATAAVDQSAEAKPAEALPAAAPAGDSAAAPAVEPADQGGAASVPSASEPPASDAYTTYTVKQGDDLYSVAIKWGVTASQLKEINNLPDDDTLTPGQVLKIPAKAE